MAVNNRIFLLCSASLLVAAAPASISAATPAGVPAAPGADSGSDASGQRDDTALSTIVVTGQRAGITNLKATATVTGLDQAIKDIPRSVTTLDSTLLKEIQVRSIHDLTIASAGTYTSAFFGVAGAVQVRGNFADTYYHGFKGMNNLGYYETPTESVSNVEIVKGPISPYYGAGKLGGMVDYTPKADIAASIKSQTKPSALVTFETGSNSLIRATVEAGAPFKVGDNNAALYLYGYYNRHGAYYKNFNPNDKEIQGGYSMDIGDHWVFNLGGRYLDTKGHLAAPGWNRVTQDLIDNGNYIAGSPAINLAQAGEQGLLPSDLSSVINSLRRTANFVTGVIAAPTAYTALDPATVKTVKLSRRDINTSPLDYNNNKVGTAYLDLIRTADNGDSLKVQGFFDSLVNDRAADSGSANQVAGHVFETRLSYFARRDIADWLSVQAIFGGSFRDYTARDFENYPRRYVLWDRADNSTTLTPDMIINNPMLNPVDANRWDFRYSSNVKNEGAFINTDIALFDRLHVQGGLRYDHYKASTINRGLISFGGALNTWYSGTANPLNYQVSVNYVTPFGITPYFTYAKNKSIEMLNGGGIDPSLIIGKDFMSPSTLKEAGFKATLFDDRLFFTAAAYKQVRSQLDAQSLAVSTSHSKGIELEARGRVTRRFDLLGTATFQKTRQTGVITLVLTPAEVGLTCQQACAGEWTTTTAQVPSLAKGFTDTTLPARTFSLFGNYRLFDGLTVSAGGLNVSHTSGIVPGAVHIPSYTTLRALASYTFKRYTIDVAVDNLTDERYFYLGTGTSGYSEVAVLPGAGRTFTVRLAAKF